jgi:hypothetical protein
MAWQSIEWSRAQAGPFLLKGGAPVESGLGEIGPHSQGLCFLRQQLLSRTIEPLHSLRQLSKGRV